VLVAAELHQQFLTPEVGEFRASFSRGMSSQAQALLLASRKCVVFSRRASGRVIA
jgi:hypothetical protein